MGSRSDDDYWNNKYDHESSDIDDLVEEWHDGDSDLSLAEYLGMTDEQHAQWVMTGEDTRG